MSSTADIIQEFWRLMATNDFGSVSGVLSDDFVLEWSQSKERIRGAHNFARMNAEYPAAGAWRFTINRLVAVEGEGVTDVTVTDGVRTDRAISFFTVERGRITKIVEYWPDSYPAPDSRRHLVEPME
jgi:ketosteroid isomerase-like protein